MTPELSLETALSNIDKYNNRVASLLSLIPNKPDDKGRNRVEQESDRLERTRSSWEPEGGLRVGERVLIPAGTPVGLGIRGFYVAEKSIVGTLKKTSGGYGGDGYLQHSTQRLYSLFRVSVDLPNGMGEPIEEVSLLVPNDMLKTIPKEPVATI